MSSTLLSSRLILCALSVFCVGAGVPPARPPSAQAPTSPGENTSMESTIDSAEPYQGPAVAVTLNRDAGARRATVNVTFPTGGWELKHDRTRVKDGFGVVHFTFSAPGRDEMVAQVLGEKEWAWQSADPFSRAEVWVRIVRRGQAAPREYRLAAKAP
jgi:hypothetical protein